jgi:organic hydroperoxide reductase OsmC/OhrA
MAGRTHGYRVRVVWTGNTGVGTAGYRDYARSHEIHIDGKPVIAGSSDTAFRGEPNRHTPEELLVASLSQCHMLWYLHLAATNDVVVIDYTDTSEGTMRENPDGSGEFTLVTLRPTVTVARQDMVELAKSLHAKANRMCFIARSVNFPVHHEPTITFAGRAG